MNPAELGPLTVHVKLEDSTAQITFTAHHAATRDAIEAALPRLRDMFSTEGLTLGNTDVTDHGVRHGNDGERRAPAGMHGALVDDADTEVSEQPLRRVHAGMVDTFA
jgi:flagellar hook-length control protein FliK